MKIRIRGNSIRLRLSRTEVQRLSESGYLEEQTTFPENKFSYALQSVDTGNDLFASFNDGKITVFIPNKLIKDWPSNNLVGFNSTMQVNSTDSLFLLVEKDFVCLDETNEDQSDNYENPNKNC